MIKPRYFAAFFALVASVTCASSPPQQLDRSAWHIVTLDGMATERDPRIEFARGQISGSSGCNGFGGLYFRRGPLLVVKELIATEMGCGGQLNRQERAIFALLGPNLRLRFGSGRLLYLSNGKHSAVLRRAATCSSCNLPPAPLPLPSLVGKSWVIESINQKPVSQPKQAAISFTKDRFSATVGCNRMGGSYRIGKVEYIVTGRIAQTVQACLGSVGEEEGSIGKLLNDDPWMERVSKPGESIRIRLSSGQNEAIIAEQSHLGRD